MTPSFLKGLKALGAILAVGAMVGAPFIALGQFRAEAAQMKSDVAELKAKTSRMEVEKAQDRQLLERIDERTLQIQQQLNRYPR